MPIQPQTPDRQQPIAQRLRVCVSKLAPAGWMFFPEQSTTAKYGVGALPSGGRFSMIGKTHTLPVYIPQARESSPHSRRALATTRPAMMPGWPMLKSFWHPSRMAKISQTAQPGRARIKKSRRTESTHVPPIQSEPPYGTAFADPRHGPRNPAPVAQLRFFSTLHPDCQARADVFSGATPDSTKSFPPEYSSPIFHTQPHNPILMMN
jgi:hypothetical protein